MAKKRQTTEYDSVYFLKILLYLIVGSIWINHNGQQIFPVGLILGILMVQHERLQLDRKIEYAVLLVAAILGMVGIGIRIAF